MKTQNPLHIFKAGTQTAMSGAVLNFSESDLAASAAAYDPALHEAPIVVGHPKVDAPAYGWVKTLQANGSELFAEPAQVDPAFAELVEAGRYKKISASFYSPTAPGNPVPGVYYLRHVGFLGAQPPAVKGLKQIEFGDADDGIIEFSDWDDVVNAGMWRTLRDWLISKFGLEEANKAIASWDVGALEQEAQKPEETQTNFLPTSFSESTQENTVNAEDAKKLTDENAALKARLAAADLEKRTAEFSEFLSGLITAGKVLPVEKDNLLNFAQALSAEDTVEFSEGESKVSHTHIDAFKQLLSARPVVVNFGEHAKGEIESVDMNDPHAIKAAAEKLQKEMADKGQSLSYAEAVQQVVHS